MPARADSTSAGLSGFGEMRTPEILTGNRSQITLSGRYSLLPEAIGTRVVPALGYTQGLGDHAEAGLQLPFLIHDGDSGLGNIPIAGKYQFFDWSGLQLAAVGAFELPTAPQAKNYATGKLGFEGELIGMLNQGAISVVTSIGYGKSDYCPRCTLIGDQVRTPKYLPVLRLSEGFSVSWTDTMAFAELHFTTVSTGSQSGFLRGDPDVYALAGARTDLPGGFSVTGYGGLGVPQLTANTRQVVALLAHYTIGVKPPAAPRFASYDTKGPLLRVDVVNGCGNSAAAGMMVALLKGKYDARLVGKMAKNVDVTTVSFLADSQPTGMELAKLIPGSQKMSKLKTLPPGIAARVITGCELGAAIAKMPAAKPAAPKPPAVIAPPVVRAPPPAPVAPAAPLAPKKPKELMNVAVVNGCSKPGLAEENATVLIIDGYNVARIADEPKPGNAADTVVRFRSQYQEEAHILAGKLAGTMQYVADDALPADADILVTIGCGK